MISFAHQKRNFERYVMTTTDNKTDLSNMSVNSKIVEHFVKQKIIRIIIVNVLPQNNIKSQF